MHAGEHPAPSNLIVLAEAALGDLEKRTEKEFTEPVALLSTRPSDLPLPRTAARLSFDLLALRARCEAQPMVRFEHRQEWRVFECRTLRRSCAPQISYSAADGWPDDRAQAYHRFSGPLAPLLQGTSKCLAAREHRPEEVAVLFHALERLAHPEAARRHVLC
jgi:hypothetical protein